VGNNDQLHKRKFATASTLRRREAIRAPFKRILIVTEGSETERSYFEPFRDKLNMPTVVVKIDGKCDSAPISVVNYALALIRRENFDYIYCVFDRDNHETYEAAKSKILKESKKIHIKSITTIPCVEFWFILHFYYTRAPIEASNGKSCGDNTVSALKLKEGFSDYNKKLT
jgi:hypothetical protein